MEKKIVLLILICLSFSVDYGQMYQKKKIPLVDLDGSYKMKHFYVSPGLTYMLPFQLKESDDDIKARGRISMLLEFGRYHIFKGGGNIFNYMDYGLSYKRLAGSEIESGSKKLFKQNYLSLNYNINNIYQFSDTKFLQSSIGANLDFKFSEKEKEEKNIYKPTPENTDRLLFSFHLKVGYGIKIQNKLFLIPTIETPILNINEWENGRSSYGLFNSRYRPLLVKLRILWLKRPNPGDCPPVYLNPEDKARYERNYMQ